MSTLESHANAKKKAGRVPKQFQRWLNYVKKERNPNKPYADELKRLAKSYAKTPAGLASIARAAKKAGKKAGAKKAPCKTGRVRKMKDGTKKGPLTSWSRFTMAVKGRVYKSKESKRAAYLRWLKKNNCPLPGAKKAAKKAGAKKTKKAGAKKTKKAHKNAIASSDITFEDFERQFLQSMGHTNARRTSAVPKAKLSFEDDYDFEDTYAENLTAHANARSGARAGVRKAAPARKAAPKAQKLVAAADEEESVAHENARRRKRRVGGARRKRSGRKLQADEDEDGDDMELLADQ